MFLQQVSRARDVSWYGIGGHDGAVQRWIVSTPETVDICNRPELLGVAYSDALQDGMTRALATAPFGDLLTGTPSERLCIMNFLRGSLNFGLRGALSRSLGSNRHATCFMSSQRHRKDGVWHVKEDMYRKIRIPEAAVMLVGDVVATGSTVANGLRVILDIIREQGTTLHGLVFFTLGGPNIEAILEDVHARLAAEFSTYAATHLVYLEGRFTLAEKDTPLVGALPGTDLLKWRALLSPELELSQYTRCSYPLERCIIYDAGSRAFDVTEYLDDVVGWWEQVRRLAKRGRSLGEALRERWPEDDYASRETLLQARAATWRGVDETVVDALWQAHQQRWTAKFTEWAGRPDALLAVADEQLGRLRA